MLLLWMLVDFHGARERFIQVQRVKRENENLTLTTQRSQVTDVGSLLFFFLSLDNNQRSQIIFRAADGKKLFIH